MNNIIKLSDYHKKSVRDEVFDILDALADDYELYVDISDNAVDAILNDFYDYYLKVGIVAYYREDMINHFNDLAIDAVDSDALVDVDFVLEELKLYELLDSRVEVNPKDTKKIVERLRKKLIVNEGREHNKKL